MTKLYHYASWEERPHKYYWKHQGVMSSKRADKYLDRLLRQLVERFHRDPRETTIYVETHPLDDDYGRPKYKLDNEEKIEMLKRMYGQDWEATMVYHVLGGK